MADIVASLEALGRKGGDLDMVERAGASAMSPPAVRRALRSCAAAVANPITGRRPMACLVAAPDHEPLPTERPVQPDHQLDDGEQQAA